MTVTNISEARDSRAESFAEGVSRRIRARMAMLDINQLELARQLGRPDSWLSRRLSTRGSRFTMLNTFELGQIAYALKCDPVDLIPAETWAPWDSNPQPAAYRVSAGASKMIMIGTTDQDHRLAA